MRKTLFLSAFIGLGLISCDFKTNTSPKVYIVTFTVDEVSGNTVDEVSGNTVDEVRNTVDEVSGKPSLSGFVTIVNSDYFEVELCSLVDAPEIYIARKDFKSRSIRIIGEDRSLIIFKSSAEFLSFMSERNYEMANQSKGQYCTEYTFKKKK